MKPDVKRDLEDASSAIVTAHLILSMHRETFIRFLNECRDMEDFGHIVDPTLYRDPERRAVSALMQPLFEKALLFVRFYERHIEQSKEALAKVQAQ